LEQFSQVLLLGKKYAIDGSSTLLNEEQAYSIITKAGGTIVSLSCELIDYVVRGGSSLTGLEAKKANTISPGDIILLMWNKQS
jgi:hypothetical protein